MNMNIPMQPTPVAYIIIQSASGVIFQEEVNKQLKEGWTFHGPTAISANGLFTQPMILIEIRPVKMGKLDSAIVPVEGILQP